MTVLAIISDTQRIGMSTGALYMDVPSNRSALLNAVVGSLCSGLVGTCDVSIVAQRRRVLSSHNMAQPPPTVLLEAQRSYDFAASASQTNLSASSSDMIADGVASLGVTVDSVALTSLAVTITVTEVGPVTESSLAGTLGGGVIASSFAAQLPTLRLNVSAPVILAPPLPPPALPPPTVTVALTPAMALAPSFVGDGDASSMAVTIASTFAAVAVAIVVLLISCQSRASCIFIRRHEVHPVKPTEKRGARMASVEITPSLGARATQSTMSSVGLPTCSVEIDEMEMEIDMEVFEIEQQLRREREPPELAMLRVTILTV